MNQNLTHRKATIANLRTIVNLLLEDELGQTREQFSAELDQAYIDAFYKIDSDPHQYLMIVEMNKEIVGTCHRLSCHRFIGSTRMQIEAVRISEKYRGKHFGEWMMSIAMKYGKSKGVSIVQLTTNKKRPRAKQFYERLGFEATHEGMKLYNSNE